MTEKEQQPTFRDGHDNHRVYTRHGTTAHTIWYPFQPYARCNYCGFAPREETEGWLGTGNMTEREKALGLPYCKERK